MTAGVRAEEEIITSLAFTKYSLESIGGGKELRFNMSEYWHSKSPSKNAVIVIPAEFLDQLSRVPDKQKYEAMAPTERLYAALARDGYIVLRNSSRGFFCHLSAEANATDVPWKNVNQYINECIDYLAVLSTSTENLVADLKQEVDMARRDFPGRKICILGTSEEGIIAARYLSKSRKKNISALITIGTPYNSLLDNLPYNIGLSNGDLPESERSRLKSVLKSAPSEFREALNSRDRYGKTVLRFIKFNGLPWEVPVPVSILFEAERHIKNNHKITFYLRNFKGKILSVFSSNDDRLDSKVEIGLARKLLKGRKNSQIMEVNATHSLWPCLPEQTLGVCKNDTAYLEEIERAIEASCP